MYLLIGLGIHENFANTAASKVKRYEKKCYTVNDLNFMKARKKLMKLLLKEQNF